MYIKLFAHLVFWDEIQKFVYEKEKPQFKLIN
jgi:hypothetical protein